MGDPRTMVLDDFYKCKVSLTDEGWRFYFFANQKTGDAEITVLKDGSLRVRMELPKEEDHK